MSRQIRLEEHVYERIKANKRADESFSEAVERLIGDVDAAVSKERELEAEDVALVIPGIGKGDAAVAATALTRDEPVLAGDRHFGSIPGVELETYR